METKTTKQALVEWLTILMVWSVLLVVGIYYHTPFMLLLVFWLIVGIAGWGSLIHTHRLFSEKRMLKLNMMEEVRQLLHKMGCRTKEQQDQFLDSDDPIVAIMAGRKTTPRKLIASGRGHLVVEVLQDALKDAMDNGDIGD